MKLLALTDIHGAYHRAEKIIRREAADVVIIGGDLTTAGPLPEAEEALDRFRSCSMRLLFVSGNMDLPAVDDLARTRGLSIDGRGIAIGEIGFFGVSAAPLSRLHTPYEISEEEIAARAGRGYADVNDCRLKIFVPHAPPLRTKLDVIRTGEHVGSSAVREFIERTGPDLVLCGHIHEARGLDTIGQTAIVNCGPAVNGNYAVVHIGERVSVSLADDMAG